jgi:hypothetical protein
MITEISEVPDECQVAKSLALKAHSIAPDAEYAAKHLAEVSVNSLWEELEYLVGEAGISSSPRCGKPHPVHGVNASCTLRRRHYGRCGYVVRDVAIPALWWEAQPCQIPGGPIGDSCLCGWPGSSHFSRGTP